MSTRTTPIESMIRAEIEVIEQELARLRTALAALNGGAENGSAPKQATLPSGNPVSFKDQVFAALGTRWMTIQQLTKETGLTRDRVRNVLNDTRFRADFQRRKAGGSKFALEYHWAGEPRNTEVMR